MNPLIENIPPFPDGVRIAPIARISFAKILGKDAAEGEKVLEACKTDGFFYLDLQSCVEGRNMFEEAESIVDAAAEFFELPLEMKKKYASVKGESVAGYKEAGSVKQTDARQQPDTTEFLNVFKDHMHNIKRSREYPDAIMNAKAIIQAFNMNAHACATAVLSVLARQLAISHEEFTSRHDFQSPSEDQLRITRTPSQKVNADSIGLAPHTDFGSVTILFNWLGGLQIQSRDSNRKGGWDFVKPLTGHAIINLGDAMVVFTNGELKSAKHRVIPPPGEQANYVRHSLVYFLRPTDQVLMKPIDQFNRMDPREHDEEILPMEDGVVYNAAEWMVKRAGQMGAWDSKSEGKLDELRDIKSKI